jgi:predicted patatin/cPLA2 family phospholipase
MVLSGGGDKGSYQAAVLKTLIDNLPPKEVTWDVVTGVSAGTLNGAALAVFAPGDEKAFVDFVYELWNTVDTSKVLKFWPGGIAAGLTIAPSLFDNSPLRQLLKDVVGDKSIKRHFAVGTCDANTAEYVVYKFEPSDEPLPDYTIETLIASAAIDGVFPPVLRDGRTLVDGGSIWNANIMSAIEGCRDLGYTDKDIILDYVLCSESHVTPAEDLADFHTIKHGLNAWDIRGFYSSMGDIERATIFYPDVNFRYTIAPSEKLNSSPIPLDFS